MVSGTLKRREDVAAWPYEFIELLESQTTKLTGMLILPVAEG